MLTEAFNLSLASLVVIQLVVSHLDLRFPDHNQ